jgi:hypothetical protein
MCYAKGYEVSAVNSWEPYDPSWLVELVSPYRSDYPWLVLACAQCLTAQKESEYYTHFVDPKSAEWKFKKTISLKDESNEEYVVDILEGNRVGGIESLSKLINNS